MEASNLVRCRRDAVASRTGVCRAAELERANAGLDAFAQQLAHELRTPIGQVAGIAQLLLQRLDEHELTSGLPDGRRWLQLQLQAAQQMGETVQALLELARGGRAALQRAPVDLSALCHSLVEQLPPLPRRAAVQWHIAQGMRLIAAPPLLALLMRNLLSNAAKYTREVAAPRVSVGLHEAAPGEGGGPWVRVADNGTGFDQAAAAGLFQPFARLPGAEGFDGLGLGLSIVRRVVDLHGGLIRAHGTVGEGACFEFQLGAGTPAGGSGGG